MRILIVEDSRRLRQALETGLRRTGFAVDMAADGEKGYALARTGDYDVIVLDIMLPLMDGLQILRKLREEGNDTHVLMLTAKDAIEQRVTGLRAGADDYLVKPFAFDELVARLQALTRRRHGVKNPEISVGPLTVNLAARTVARDGENVVLTAREYALLEYLAIRRGQIVTRSEIEDRIYDGRVEPASNVVDSAVCNLRKKIDGAKASSSDSLIQTRRNLGYVLDEVSR
jgi:DNA-binding response OmpR family regulator